MTKTTNDNYLKYWGQNKIKLIQMKINCSFCIYLMKKRTFITPTFVFLPLFFEQLKYGKSQIVNIVN